MEELIEMVRPKEIQDLVPWKVGTLTDRGMIGRITDNKVFGWTAWIWDDDGAFWLPNSKKDLIKIPTERDMGKALEPYAWDYEPPQVTSTSLHRCNDIQRCIPFEADTELKARLQLFMWLAHGWCPRCGSRMMATTSGWYCPCCYHTEHEG